MIRISDTTLCREDGGYSFKESIEIARQLERLNVDTIEMPVVRNPKTDILLVRTISAFVRNAALSVGAGRDRESIENAAAALSAAKRARIRIELPVSPVGMEYTCHKKPAAMLAWIGEAIRLAKESCSSVEFCAVDATRAEPEFLREALLAAKEAGAGIVTICDNASKLLPDDFAEFLRTQIATVAPLPIGVRPSNRLGLATAEAVLAARAGAVEIKTAIGGDAETGTTDLETFAGLIRECGNDYGLSSALCVTELHRIIRQIEWIRGGGENGNSGEKASAAAADGQDSLLLDENESAENVSAAVKTLGYDLSEEDLAKVYDEFLRVAAKKKIGVKELDAIVASVALEVPATYRLESYVINNGNIISSSAQITLSHGDEKRQGICLGDGPIDAAFRAIEQIIGHHYELDDFRISSVTEGKEAVGSAVVRLRADGKLYSGGGISTDVVGAGIRAYLAAINKIVYEEAQI